MICEDRLSIATTIDRQKKNTSILLLNYPIQWYISHNDQFSICLSSTKMNEGKNSKCNIDWQFIVFMNYSLYESHKALKKMYEFGF